MRKIIIIAISCCTVLLLLGYTGFRGYQMWKEKRWFNLAKDYAAKSDYAGTGLCLQQVLRFNAKNLEACRMMAALKERERSPAALIWRERVLELNPDSMDDRLALAKTAYVMRDYAIATNTLESVEASRRNSADYHNLAGTVAAATRQFDVAVTHFVEASRLQPWNSVPQVNLAIVRLNSTNSLDLAEARIALTRVSLNATNGDLRCQALRELVGDARRSKQVDSALAFSNQLLEQTNSIFADRLQRLDILREARLADLKGSLIACQRDAGNDPGKILQLAGWEVVYLGPTNAFGWLTNLPASTQTNQLVALALADCRAQLADWKGLQNTVANQHWGELDFLRHAFLTRSLREQGLTGAATAEWVHTLESTGRQKTRLAKLLEFTVVARWRNEPEEILWKIVNLYPDDQLASQALAQLLFDTGRTPLLLNLYTLQSRRRPDDLDLKNNLATAALLLNKQELKPHEIAREVYDKAPTNAAYASTFAFSLHLQKKDAEALKVMQQLPPQALEDHSIAGYYGLILNATGNPAKAATYLVRASEGHLLPEEKKLFERSLSGG